MFVILSHSREPRTDTATATKSLFNYSRDHAAVTTLSPWGPWGEKKTLKYSHHVITLRWVLAAQVKLGTSLAALQYVLIKTPKWTERPVSHRKQAKKKQYTNSVLALCIIYRTKNKLDNT